MERTNDAWGEITSLPFSRVCPFTARVDEAERAVMDAIDELLFCLRRTRPTNARSAASRVLADIAALRRMAESGPPPQVG